MDRLDDHPGGGSQQDHGVELGGQDLGPLQAEGVGRRGRPAAQPDGQEGQGQARDVGEQVGRVGQQGQRPEDEGGHGLGEHQRRVGRQRDDESDVPGGGRPDDQAIADSIGRRIAQLLPPEYRGVYA